MWIDCLGYSVELAGDRIAEPPAEITRQIKEYTAGERIRFDLTVLLPDGFDGRVARALRTIPYGDTRTYGAVAADLGTAPRAVGGACARNPLPIIVPCHRLRRTDGSLGGYQYPGLKSRLLTLESTSSNGPVSSRVETGG